MLLIFLYKHYVLHTVGSICVTLQKTLSLTENPMDFFEIKRADRNASEYHVIHYHMEKGGSKTHPRHISAHSVKLKWKLTIQYFCNNLNLQQNIYEHMHKLTVMIPTQHKLLL